MNNKLSDKEVEEFLNRAAVNAKDKENDISVEEVDKLREAFKKKEFRDMFEEYMTEISDPKHRAEQEAYLEQLERENKAPAGKELIRPKPAFVIKVKKQGDSTEKVFINIVQTPKVEDAKSNEGTNEDGKKGLYWNIPHLIGPGRLEKDKEGKNCMTFDVAYAETTLQRVELDSNFRTMVVNTSIEAVEKAMSKESKKEVNLERKFHVLKNVPYKGEVRQTLLVSKSSTVEPQAKPKPLSTPASSASTKNSEKPVVVKSSLPPGVLIPKYTIVHRGAFDLATFQEGDDTKRPKELVVRIELPKCSSAAGVDLDVSDMSLVLEKEGVYRLSIKLPYPIINDGGTAKFDKASKILEVTLKVAQPEKKIKKFEEPKSDLVEEIPTPPETLTNNNKELNEEESKPKKKDIHSRWIDPELSAKSSFPSSIQIPSLPSPSQVTVIEEEKEKKDDNNVLFAEGTNSIMLTNGIELQKCIVCNGYGSLLIHENNKCYHCCMLQTPSISNKEESQSTPLEEVLKEQSTTVEKCPDSVLIPEYRIRQSQSCVFINISVDWVDSTSVNLECYEKSMSVTFQSTNGQKYSLSLNLGGKIDPNQCRHVVADRNLMLLLQKPQNACVQWPSFEDNVNKEMKENKVDSSVIIEKEVINVTEPPPAVAEAKKLAPVSWKNEIMYELE